MNHFLAKWSLGIFVGVTICTVLSQEARCQSSVGKNDPFNKRMARLELRDETFLDALGKLNQIYDVA